MVKYKRLYFGKRMKKFCEQSVSFLRFFGVFGRRRYETSDNTSSPMHVATEKGPSSPPSTLGQALARLEEYKKNSVDTSSTHEVLTGDEGTTVTHYDSDEDEIVIDLSNHS